MRKPEPAKGFSTVGIGFATSNCRVSCCLSWRRAQSNRASFAKGHEAKINRHLDSCCVTDHKELVVHVLVLSRNSPIRWSGSNLRKLYERRGHKDGNHTREAIFCSGAIDIGIDAYVHAYM